MKVTCEYCESVVDAEKNDTCPNCGAVTVVDEDEIPGFSWEPLETAQDVQEAPTSETFVETED